MSTLSIKLKQRASVLAVGVALSAATLALSPGVAQATGTDTVGDCVCGLIGEITDTSGGNTGGETGGNGGSGDSASQQQDHNIGAVQAGDVTAAPDTNVQSNLLTKDSSNNYAAPSQSGSGGNGGSGSSGECASPPQAHTIGTVQTGAVAAAPATNVESNLISEDSSTSCAAPSSQSGSDSNAGSSASQQQDHNIGAVQTGDVSVAPDTNVQSNLLTSESSNNYAAPSSQSGSGGNTGSSDSQHHIDKIDAVQAGAAPDTNDKNNQSNILSTESSKRV